jgi:SPP1 gp7 family putative phage head morphogenesis protein
MNVDKEIALSASFILPHLENYLKESAMESLILLAPQEDFTDSKRIQKLIKDRAESFGDSITATTLEKLDRTLAEGLAEGEGIIDLSDRVNEVYDEFSTYRSDMIARTEATYANARGNIEGFRQSGVANAKEWINSGDDRVRDEHEDGIGVGGEIVDLDEDFSNGLSEPGEPNCRCVIGPAFIE